MTYYDTNDRPITRDEQKNAITLRAVQIDNAPEKRFDFDLSKVTVFGAENNFYLWDKNSFALKEEKESIYVQTKIQGVHCLKVMQRDGRFTLGGRDDVNGIEIRKYLNDKKIIRVDKFTGGHGIALYDKMKARYEVSEWGQATLLEKFLYDEKGELVREINQEEIISYSGSSAESRSRKTDKVLWSKQFDDKGRIKAFRKGLSAYTFSYDGENTEISILNKDNSLASKVIVPTSEVSKTLFTQTRGN
jgi:hypothetical protein